MMREKFSKCRASLDAEIAACPDCARAMELGGETCLKHGRESHQLHLDVVAWLASGTPRR